MVDFEELLTTVIEGEIERWKQGLEQSGGHARLANHPEETEKGEFALVWYIKGYVSQTIVWSWLLSVAQGNFEAINADTNEARHAGFELVDERRGEIAQAVQPWTRKIWRIRPVTDTPGGRMGYTMRQIGISATGVTEGYQNSPLRSFWPGPALNRI